MKHTVALKSEQGIILNSIFVTLILDCYPVCFAAMTKTFIFERCGPQTKLYKLTFMSGIFMTTKL